MWNHFVKNCNDKVKVNMLQSFYCGDAAGRPKTATKARDFSDGDLKFAFNSKLPFYLPEDIVGPIPTQLEGRLKGEDIGSKKQQ
jgi:bifunctional polynucleotide phosphatase/kinase